MSTIEDPLLSPLLNPLLPRADTASSSPFITSISFPSGFPSDGSTPTITLPSISTPTLPSISTPTFPSISTPTLSSTTLVTVTGSGTTTLDATGTGGAIVGTTVAPQGGSNTGNGTGLTAGAAAGIGVAVTIVALSLIGLGVWLVMRRRRRNRQLAGSIVGSIQGEGHDGDEAEKRGQIVEADPSSQVYESAGKEVSEVDGVETGKGDRTKDAVKSHEMLADTGKVAELPGSTPKVS